MAFSLPPELLASAADITLPNLLEAQERLEAEAREVLPYSFDECTFSKGAIRQSVWSCMGESRAYYPKGAGACMVGEWARTGSLGAAAGNSKPKLTPDCGEKGVCYGCSISCHSGTSSHLHR
jgi:E3 ubiquitin-protein ligase UBR7